MVVLMRVLKLCGVNVHHGRFTRSADDLNERHVYAIQFSFRKALRLN